MTEGFHRMADGPKLRPKNMVWGDVNCPTLLWNGTHILNALKNYHRQEFYNSDQKLLRSSSSCLLWLKYWQKCHLGTLETTAG